MSADDSTQPTLIVLYPNGGSLERIYLGDLESVQDFESWFRVTSMFAVHQGWFDIDEIPPSYSCDFFILSPVIPDSVEFFVPPSEADDDDYNDGFTRHE